MIILLEGQNGVGKTAVANELVKLFGFKYHKENRFTWGEMTRSYEPYMRKSLELEDNTIQDRWHLGECVYPFIKNDGRPGLLPWQQHAVERVLANKGCFLIKVIASRKFIERVYKDRGEDFITLNDTVKERALFDQAYSNSILPKYSYFNFGGNDFTSLVGLENIISFIKQMQKSLAPFKGSYIPIDPTSPDGYDKVMLVGDRFNENHRPPDHAFSGYEKGCSNFLQQILYDTGYPDRFYLTNAFKTGDHTKNKELFLQELKVVDPLEVVTLGKKAQVFVAEVLKKEDSPLRNFHALPHPQFVHRFHGKEGALYAARLRHFCS